MYLLAISKGAGADTFFLFFPQTSCGACKLVRSIGLTYKACPLDGPASDLIQRRRWALVDDGMVHWGRVIVGQFGRIKSEYFDAL
jgi:hypothetical protein